MEKMEVEIVDNSIQIILAKLKQNFDLQNFKKTLNLEK
jgi:hypothetical protein